MKNILRRAGGKTLAGFVLAACISFCGCEAEKEPDAGNNYGEGKDSFSVAPNYNRQTRSAQRTVAVRENTPYDVTLECSNDGDSEALAIIIDGVQVGSYTTAENRENGSGWSIMQYSGPYRVISKGKTMDLRVNVSSSGDGSVFLKNWIVARKDE